uniref:MYND-type domain-containing protein n=1 Tax=Ditylenchus dipsaci TaxID=166011 RepID=A0A915E4X7_9BILA
MFFPSSTRADFYSSTSSVNSDAASTSMSFGPGNMQNKSDNCNFCRASAAPNAPLIRCGDCFVVAYCGLEHKNFDYKRHKLLCYQWRKSSSSKSNSTKSSSSNTSTSNGSSNKNEKDMCIIQTEDDDIQIIESETNPKNVSSNKRKRPLGNEKMYKDHSKNLLFKTTLQQHIKNLADSGLAVNQHQAVALRLRYIAEHVIRSLNEYGWAVVDNFLGKSHCKHTYMEVERLYKNGLFSAGQLVDGGNRKEEGDPQEIRSDRIYWFDSADKLAKDSVTVRLLISMLDSVLVHFSDRIPPYKISGRSRAMIAVYPGMELVTWKLADHGGTLRLYPETSDVPMDIDPQADRVVFFWSDRRNPHEVLPVFRDRYAITIWYFDYVERQKALELKKKNEGEAASLSQGGVIVSLQANSQESSSNGDASSNSQLKCHLDAAPAYPQSERVEEYRQEPEKSFPVSGGTEKSKQCEKVRYRSHLSEKEDDSSSDIDEIVAEVEAASSQKTDFEI